MPPSTNSCAIGANPGRSGHQLAQQADDVIEETRALLAAFFHAPDPQQVVFTFSCTDGLNMVIKGLLQAGDHAITSNLEHNSVSRPLRSLKQHGIEVTYLQADAHGYLHADDLAKIMQPNTKLVVISHASNVLGTIQDVSALAQATHRHGALLALDAAQTAGFCPIDMQAMGIDILVVPGHKGLLGPYGTGAVVTCRDVGIKPWREGGTGIKSEARLQPTTLPYRLEAGTLNAAGIAGLNAGLKFIQAEGIETIQQKTQQDIQLLLDILLACPQATVYGPTTAAQRAGLVSYNIAGLSIDELAQHMNHLQIAGRLACIVPRWRIAPQALSPTAVIGSARATSQPRQICRP